MRTNIVSTAQAQLTTKATHELESQEQASTTVSKCSTDATHFLGNQGQASSAGSKGSSPRQPPTSWKAKGRSHQQGPMRPNMEVTCFLESHGQASSARSKCSSPLHPLTSWTGIVSRVEKHEGMATTHELGSQQPVVLDQSFS